MALAVRKIGNVYLYVLATVLADEYDSWGKVTSIFFREVSLHKDLELITVALLFIAKLQQHHNPVNVFASLLRRDVCHKLFKDNNIFHGDTLRATNLRGYIIFRMQ
jgi:hypothetical protein